MINVKSVLQHNYTNKNYINPRSVFGWKKELTAILFSTAQEFNLDYYCEYYDLDEKALQDKTPRQLERYIQDHNLGSISVASSPAKAVAKAVKYWNTNYEKRIKISECFDNEFNKTAWVWIHLDPRTIHGEIVKTQSDPIYIIMWNKY